MNGLTEFLKGMFDGLHVWIITLFNMEPSGVSYVLTIAIFTLIIKLLLLPLNIKSSRSSARLQEIQPQLNAIQQKYKNDPKKMQEEYNKCLKENNASMFGGCLPSLLPLPILFALYAVFNSISPDSMQNASFLWIPNVFGKDPYFILPVLAFLSTYIPNLLLTKATPKNENGPNMGNMSITMAIMMGVMAINFRAILVIYWVISGVIQLIQTYFVNYLPAKKKQKEKEEQEKYKVIENAKKATPKTRKR